jgi:hypothetical protein
MVGIPGFASQQKHPLTTSGSGCLEVERKGVEPSTFALRTRTPTDDAAAVTGDSKRVTPNASRGAGARCTNGCTGEAENDNGTTAEVPGNHAAGDRQPPRLKRPKADAANDAEPTASEGADSLAMLAAALVNLSAADRAKLAAMLLQGGDSKADGSTRKAGRKDTGRRKAKG